MKFLKKFLNSLLEKFEIFKVFIIKRFQVNNVID